MTLPQTAAAGEKRGLTPNLSMKTILEMGRNDSRGVKRRQRNTGHTRPQLLGRLRKEGRPFKANLGNLLRPSLKIKEGGV